MSMKFLRNLPVTQPDRVTLVGACLATGDRIFATGSDIVSKIVLRSCVGFVA